MSPTSGAVCRRATAPESDERLSSCGERWLNRIPSGTATVADIDSPLGGTVMLTCAARGGSRNRASSDSSASTVDSPRESFGASASVPCATDVGDGSDPESTEDLDGEGNRMEDTEFDDVPDGTQAVPLTPECRVSTLEFPRGERLSMSLVCILTHLVSLGCRPHAATCFHAVRRSPVSIQEYLHRIVTWFPCRDECLVLGLVYIDRIVKWHPGFVVSGLNIHRLLVTSIMLAVKFSEDVFFSNAHYAKVAGLSVSELNKLEQRFVQLLHWRLHVLPEEFHHYFCMLAAAAKGNALKGASVAPDAGSLSSSCSRSRGDVVRDTVPE